MFAVNVSITFPTFGKSQPWLTTPSAPTLWSRYAYCSIYHIDVSILIIFAPIIQPDGVQRGLVGEIIKRFEQRGFKLVALKLVHASIPHLEKRASWPHVASILC